MPRYALTALIVACALFMENLDGTVISTSLPAIARDLHQDPIALKLALTSYLLALAIFIPASGWVADKFGTRVVFRAAIFVFTIGSILCGLSNSLLGFVLARIVQGAGGAMMVPVGRLLLLRTIDHHDLVKAMAYLTLPALFGPMLGPPVGGFITTYFNWRYIFWINVPIGILGMVLVTRFIANIRDENVRPLDVPGFLLSGMGLSCLVFGLTILGRGFIPPWAVAFLIGFGVLVLLAYIRHARRTPTAIIDLTLLKVQTFRVSVTGGSIFRIGVGAVPLLLPLMLQLGFGMTPLRSGLTTFVAAAGAIAMKTTAPAILNRLGFRRVLICNSVIGAGFIGLNAFFAPSTPIVLILAALLIGGFFRSLQFTSINAIAYADIDGERMSRAVSFASVAQQLALSAGVAVGAGVIELARETHGGALSLSDFHWAFAVVAALSATSLFAFIRLPADAGASLASRPTRPPAGRGIGDVRQTSAMG